MRASLGRAAAVVSIAAALAVAPHASAQSVDERGAARKVLQRWQDTVVNVRVVVKVRMSMGGREVQSSEETIETVATVLDASGLSLMSLAVLNPGGFLKQLMGGATQGGQQFDVTSEPTDVKIRLADGSEIAAKVALRDEDLNLAFIRPIAPPGKPPANLAAAELGRPAVLEPLVVVSRLGRVGGWGPSASLAEVQAVVDKPRPMYVVGAGGTAATPAFLLDGKLAGFVVMRSVGGAGGGAAMFGMMGGSSEGLGLLPIVLPAEDVREVAKQAAKP